MKKIKQIAELREVDWLNLTRFHREIAERGERGFFSKKTDDDRSDNWSFILDYEPPNMADSWKFDLESLISPSFRTKLSSNSFDTLFVGGPGFCTPKKNDRTGEWEEYWNPIFYRQVAHTTNDGLLELYPDSARWNLSPVFVKEVERLQVSFELGIDKFADEVIEEATEAFKKGNQNWSALIIDAFSRKNPELKPIFQRIFKKYPSGAPTPWGVFAPLAEFSPLTRYLIKDYERLEKHLEENPDRTGGLRCMQDLPRPKRVKKLKPIPLVPLNQKQEKAVVSMLGENPVTVVSGPPGCGKSQVVVSLLLNAWAEGKSVLFASNNNKAVDVVLDRLVKFESEFPVAVRAGNMKVNRVGETLRRIMNMCSDAEDDIDLIKENLKKTKRKSTQLEKKIKELRDARDSGLPARISEIIKSILSAVAEESESSSELSVREKNIDSSKYDKKLSADQIIREHHDLTDWWTEKKEFQSSAKNDQIRKNELEEKLKLLDQETTQLVARHGLTQSFRFESKQVDLPKIITDWKKETTLLLEENILPQVKREPSEYWKEAFNEWKSPHEVTEEMNEISDSLSNVEQKIKNFKDPLNNLLAEHEKLIEQRNSILKSFCKLSSFDESKAEKTLNNLPGNTTSFIKQWESAYAELAIQPKPPITKPIAFYRYREQMKKLLELEATLFKLYPVKIRTNIGEVSFESRKKWLEVMEETKEWISLRGNYAKSFEKMAGFERELKKLREANPSFHSISDFMSVMEWEESIKKYRTRLRLLAEARTAWEEYFKWFDAQSSIKVLGKSFECLGDKSPFWKEWIEKEGKSLRDHLISLSKGISTRGVMELPGMIKNLSVESLEKIRASFASLYSQKIEITKSLNEVPSREDHLSRWWSKGRKVSPKFRNFEAPNDWPNEQHWTGEHIATLSLWISQWHEFKDFEEEKKKIIEASLVRRREGLAHLKELIGKTGDIGDKLSELISTGLKADAEDFPVKMIQKAVSHLDEQNLINLIESTESKLSGFAFTAAKYQWQIRLADDDNAKRAVHELIRIYRQNQNQLPEESYELFESALNLAPIWITVPASSHSIPMKENAFDLLVIDEATQCSITNLLPLLYRGKKIAIIGDENQLRSIPTLFRTEELLLAKKHKVEETVSILGHYDQDVYTAGVESLPARTADVVNLQEHYRSHPQIIGFSNKQIYHGRLDLKRDFLKDFSADDGVHAIQVNGQAERGPRNRSWLNEAEAAKICDLITKNQAIAKDGRSVGVVTPFSAQANLISELLEKSGSVLDVVVGNAHVFQGDERDLIYFSPVVSPGISEGASNWVGNPPNLVNVAITRARDALYLVGDIAGLSKRRDILGELAKYGQTIEFLRDPNRKDQSPCELFMFSLMCAEGWSPQVQVQIGDAWADFVLKTKDGRKLVVETDGRIHKNQKAKDQARDAFMSAKGYIVHRVDCKNVFELPRDTIARIREVMDEPE